MSKYSLPIDYDSLTPSQRREVRLQYIDEQEGVCYFCGVSLNDSPPNNITNLKINWSLFPNNFLKEEFALVASFTKISWR